MVKCAKLEIDIKILIKSTWFLLQSPRNQLQTNTKRLLKLLICNKKYDKFKYGYFAFQFLMLIILISSLDLPQNCDPNIPLVAQELMKKMIRQFAIEYISKSGKIQ